MTRKKSRPTHRENAGAVPSNERGFYMFWNSMGTNPGTNGPNSPSQGEALVTSPPVIIISDSEGSPCAHDENLVVPLPIKEEIREHTMMSSNQHSPAETSSNAQEYHSVINGDHSSHPTCLPDQPQGTPRRAEEDGDPMKLVEDTQVCDHVTKELIENLNVSMFPKSNFSKVANSNDVSEAISFDDNVISKEARCVDGNSDNTSVANEEISHASRVPEGILAGAHSYEISEEPGVPISELQSMEGISATSNISEELPSHTETPQEMSEEAPMEPESELETPAVRQVNYEQTPHELPGLSLLRSLLNAPDEDLEDLNLEEALAELPGLIGEHNDPTDQNSQNDGEMVFFESERESRLASNIDVSDTVDKNATLPEKILTTDLNMTPDVSHQTQANEKIVDENDEFPIFNNFLPKKIKLDTIGILRSVEALKDSVRSLYKEYLKTDVILRTVGTSELAAKDDESSDEVEEMPLSFPPINVYPICCVKMERLPDPFVKKSTITMSDDTFKTWKRQIIRQRNEEKFRHLKVWRRGRMLLWRECELAGMDRATYDEQVAYVNKHKLNENSLSDSDSGDNDSEGGASSHKCDSSEESYSDLENEDSEGELSSLPSLSSPTKRRNSENQSVDSSHITSEISTDIRLSEDEYVVERTNQSSETKATSALKLTIRKASTSKSEDDKEKPADEEGNFPVPAHRTVKSRKIATKRTYRRPSDPIPKASVPPKPTTVDTKKAKNTPVEDEYDQSLLGTRSHEVENFNLLEKWDIPFEEPTLFRSPRAASRLAQLKTKEAFQPIKRHAPLKTTTSSTNITATSTTTTNVTDITVSKAVKDVVEMLCSKTVEAILFPESKSAGTKKPTKTDINSADAKDSTIHIQPSKSLVPIEETSSNLDESSEFSLSETNSTHDASSDFSGSTASLVPEDFPPPNIKSPKKPRKRRPRFGPAWGKKKKVKSKVSNERPVEKGNSKKDELSAKYVNNSPIHSTEKPVAEKVIQEKGNSTQEVSASSPVHSTQVHQVSEGPGQSPYESEDDPAHTLKGPLSHNDSNRTVNESTKETPPKDVLRLGKTPSEEPKLNEKVQAEEVVPPRLTRSKQPTVDLDPGLLENFGTRKRKPKTDVVNEVLPGEDGKKSKLEVTKDNPQKNKAQTTKPSTTVPKETSSAPDKIVHDYSNTQVPEISSSEGPGDAGLDHENTRDQLNKVETGEPTIRMLRSRSRGPGPRPTRSAISPVKHSTEDDPKTEESSLEEGKLADENRSEELLVLESPASPPPETTVEPEPFINSRITRSKRRSGPAYISVKSTVANALPSVCDVVDSIAGHGLTTPSKLFDALTPVTSSLSAKPITAFRVQTSNADHTLIIDGKVESSSSIELEQQPKVVQNESPDDDSRQSPRTIEGACHGSTLEQPGKLMDSESSSIVPVPKSITETSSVIAGQTSELSNNLIDVDIPCFQTEKSHSAAAVEGDHSTVAVEDVSSGTASASSPLALEKPVTENVECGRLEVLDTLNTILAVTSPKKVRYSVSTASPLLPPPLSSNNLQTSSPVNTSISQLPVSNILTPPTVNSTSLPGFLNSTQDINNIPCLPGTFLSSFLTSTLDTSLTTYSNEINDSTSMADDPDGDLVIDEGEVNFDVNFFENLTNADLDKNDNSADFSDDDNNTDLADKIDKIVKDQIHQDPVPMPSLKSKESVSGDGTKKVPGETSPSKSVLNRRDSIDDRTGLPTNFIQRLRDPRIRSRLLSQLEEEEATGKTQTGLAPLLNSLPANSVSPSTVGASQAGNIVSSDPRRKADVVAVVSSSVSLQVPAVSQVITQPVRGVPFETIGSAMPLQPAPMVLPNTPALATSLVAAGSLGQLPHVAQGTPIKLHLEDSDKPEEPPDPSKVDFLVPPSDDEEEESINRRPKKAKKQVDVELMYKSPLEDLQSEARPGYGKRAPRRYADNFPRRKSGDDHSSWDERRSRDDRNFEDRGRSRSRDGRFYDRRRDRSRSRDQRAFYDRSPTDQSRDRRAYDPYTGREDPETTPHPMEMQVPYNQSPWPASPAFHQMVMQSPHWQPNYHPEPHVPHPPIFVPEPPKIDFMETRLINLELLPKTTNLKISPIRKVFLNFDKSCRQVMDIPPPTYDPKDPPHTIRMMDPVSEEMVDFIQTPRPTSGLTKDIFRSFPLDLNLNDVVKFHFISPSYIMVQDNEEDPLSSSDEEEDKQKAEKNVLSPDRQQDKPLQPKKRVSKRKPVDKLQKHGGEPSLEHHSKGGNEFITGIHLNQEKSPKAIREDTPLQNLLQKLPLLQQFSLQLSQPAIPPPPPAPEWNDVDLRISRELAREETSSLAERNPSPPIERSTKRSRSRSKGPTSTSLRSPSNSPISTSHRSRRSPGSRRHRSRSRSMSGSDMSISSSRSRSRSPSYSRRGSRTPRRRRSRSRSSERSRCSWSRRSRSPKRHSTSISPSRKHRR